jgi:modulator of FtsH protease HflK
VSEQIRPDGGPARSASVTFRSQGQEVDQGPQLDPANKSLGEALALVFKLLQVGMLGLFVYFALSGFKSVKENEMGLRLVFGKPSGGPLGPGFQFSYPFPVGDLVRVDTGEQLLNIDESFWPGLSPDQKKMTLGQLAPYGRYSLDPVIDGSLMTGDGNLAHAQWSVRYHRRDPKAWVENMLDEDNERRVVRAAVERGVVQAVSQVSVDDLLKQSAGDQGSVAMRAQELAQQTLDRIQSGIHIDQLTLSQKAPPLFVLNDFSGVQSAEQRASQALDAAGTAARNTLNEVAGGAHPYLIQQIALYEGAVTKGDTQEQQEIMQTIRALLDGRPVKIGDEMVANQVSGRVTMMLNDARSYRTGVVSQSRSELEAYRTKLALFRINPEVVVQNEWTDAMATLLSRDIVDIWWLPPGTKEIDLWLNRDPRHVKEFEKARKDAELKAAEEQRMREFHESRFRTNTDIKLMSPG